MPDAPSPDELKSETEIARSVAHLLPPLLKEKFINDRPLEVRPVEFHNPLKGHVAPPARGLDPRKRRAAGRSARPSISAGLCFRPELPACCAAAVRNWFLEKGIQIATIDHSMWFHRPFNINEWLLYNVESTSASGARGFVRGEFYTQDGVLVASTVQEGVMRNRN